MLAIEHHQPGATWRPLDHLTVLFAGRGLVTVADALGRIYFEGRGEGRLTFTVGGATGWQTVTLAGGGRTETLRFRVVAETAVDDDTGEFRDLLRLLLATMLRFNEVGLTVWNGRIYRFFVCWLRDHVHTLKGMKYFSPHLRDGIEVYRDSQRADGMIWDNIHPRTQDCGAWDMRFGYGDFIRPFADGTGEFKRIPVENDVEYLFVEGLYYTWRALGDDGWLAGCLDAACRAMDYSVTSEYRWSDQYGLLKRGYTIDTWDFQNAEDATISAGGEPTTLAFGDPMVIKPGHTRFGIMFGDNTGYIASCRYLAEMLEVVGRRAEAERYRDRAAAMQARLDALAWNGRYFRHHVPEDETIVRDLGVDEASQISLSNAYSLNRGLTEEQCRAILDTYRELRDNLPPGSPGEWYTIYPPFGKGFGKHCPPWQYMNGGVTPIVAGELAHGAFEHGRESYGVDILRRLKALGEATRGHLHCAYTGSLPEPPERTFAPVDLRELAETDFRGEGAPGVPGWTGEGDNDLRELPVGAQTLGGIEWLIADPATNGRRGCVGLGPDRRESVELTSPGPTASLYLLHALSQSPDGIAGTLTWEYADGGRVTRQVLRGQQVTGWWVPEVRPGGPMVVAWRGANPVCANVGLVATGFDNPHPERPLARLRLTRNPAGGLWLVAAATFSGEPAWSPPNPVSYGIPDNWGAAAVVYALLEGLVGITDEATAFRVARLAPRWVAAGVDRATACVHYPASDGYVAYRWEHCPTEQWFELTCTGSGEELTAHVLLPAGAARVVTVNWGEQRVAFSESVVDGSRYVDFRCPGPGPTTVRVRYAGT